MTFSVDFLYLELKVRDKQKMVNVFCPPSLIHSKLPYKALVCKDRQSMSMHTQKYW